MDHLQVHKLQLQNIFWLLSMYRVETANSFAM